MYVYVCVRNCISDACPCRSFSLNIVQDFFSLGQVISREHTQVGQKNMMMMMMIMIMIM